MSTSQKILDEVISLQAYFHAGYKKATTLRDKLEGEVSTSPDSLRRKDIAAKAVSLRNNLITKRQII